MDFLHLNVRVAIAARAGAFSYAHPLVIEHRNCYKFVRSLWNELRSMAIVLPEVDVPRPLTLRQYEINTWVEEFPVEQSKLKPRHLYLYGPPHLGK